MHKEGRSQAKGPWLPHVPLKKMMAFARTRVFRSGRLFRLYVSSQVGRLSGNSANVAH
jgi:hypothetical protein